MLECTDCWEVGDIDCPTSCTALTPSVQFVLGLLHAITNAAREFHSLFR